MDNINQLLISILLSSSAFFGVKTLPAESSVWKITKSWDVQNNDLKLVAEANVQDLGCGDKLFIEFPYVLYATHAVFVDDIKFLQVGSPDFSHSNNILAQPKIRCSSVSSGKIIKWEVIGYSKYFARLHDFPIVKSNSLAAVFNETLYIGGALSLFILSLFMFVILRTESNSRYLFSVCSSGIWLSLYIGLNVAPHFRIDFPMLWIHKLADTSLFIGFYCLIVSFYQEKLVGKYVLHFITVTSVLGIFLIFMGSSGDLVQLGTSTPFIATLICLVSICTNIYKKYLVERKPEHLGKFFFGVMFTILIFWEMNIFTGTITSVSIFPVGIVFAFLILSFSVNERVREIYRERDLLLRTLEEKVRERTVELERVLKEKEIAQAELIQREKLASLGTFSAGIAHEINNSINYVNAGLIGLEKQIFKDIEPARKEKLTKLFDTVKHGTKVTIEIVNALRNYTGLNQAEMKEVRLKEIVTSVCTIIRSKLGTIKVISAFDDEISLYCNVVGMNQVFMNLISNAIDAVSKETGEILIKAHKSKDHISIVVSDNGQGMPKEVMERIFDPFFTTKEVGKGTGLGLHIIKKEIEEKHHGSIKVSSQLNKGTSFEMILPIRSFITKDVA